MAGYPGNPAVYVSSAKWTAVAAWAAATAYTAGQIIRQNAAVAGPAVNAGAERCFICIVGGTSHATTEPTWNTTGTTVRGTKYTDNTVTWQEATGLPALNGDFANTSTWAACKAIQTSCSQGHLIKDAAGTHIFIASTIAGSGLFGASEPTWDTAAVGNTTVDNAGANQITWTYLGTSFTNWGAPHARVNNSRQTGWLPGNASGIGNPQATGVSTYQFICDDHDETQSTAPTWDFNVGAIQTPMRILCVDDNNVPPTAANLSTGAKLTVTGAGTCNYQPGCYYMYGLKFVVNVNTSSDFFLASSGFAKSKVVENCVFDLSGNTSNMATILSYDDGVGGGNGEYINCTWKFGSVGQVLSVTARCVIRGGGVDPTGSLPTNLFRQQSRSGDCLVVGMDLSALANKTLSSESSSSNYQSNIRFEQCKVGAGTVFAAATGQPGGGVCTAIACDDGGQTYRHEKVSFGGSHVSKIDVVRSGGAQINSIPIGWKVVTNTVPGFYFPFKSMPITKWNADTGVTVTATIEGIVNAAAVPKNDEVWMEVLYPGSSGSPLATMKTNQRAKEIGVSGTNLTTSTEAWDAGTVGARANSHAYAVGDVIKLASNPGRVFFCTSAGTSAGSEPGGYATAIDGGSVTDSGATFRAGCRFKIEISLDTPDPQLAGLIEARLFFAKASTTYYIDPTIELG